MRKTYLSIIFYSFFLLLFSACTKDNAPDVLVPPNKSATLLDYKYGDAELQNMDVYLLKDRTPETPLIVVVHGGSWINGDKSDLDFLLSTFTASNLANVVNLNYRLANGKEITYKEMIADLEKALKTISGKSSEWNIRSSNMVLFGVSAGGHLSLLYGYTSTDDLISSIISFGGPTKFDDIESFNPEQHSNLLAALTGVVWNSKEEVPAAYYECSPYHAEHYKPTFLIHGEKDEIVPVNQAKLMQAHLAENGVDNELFILTGASHIGENASDTEMSTLYIKMGLWLMKYSK